MYPQGKKYRENRAALRNILWNKAMISFSYCTSTGKSNLWKHGDEGVMDFSVKMMSERKK